MNARRPSYEGTRLAVIGASGFIGRWVARALRAKGADVHLLVRDRARTAEICAQYGIRGTAWEVDLLDTRRLTAIISELAPAITFNLAVYGARRDEGDDQLARRINVEVLGPLCEAIRQSGRSSWLGPRLVHCGSAAEYGVAAGVVSEDSGAAPDTIYGQTKLDGTTWLARHGATSGFRSVIARLFTVYGPGEAADRLLPSLRRAARAREPVALTDGRQRRDFTFVEDVADALLRLGLANPPPGAIVHVATGVLTSVRAFAGTAAEVLGMPAERLRFGAIPRHYEEMRPSAVSVARLRDLTAWLPTTTPAEGIRRTLTFDGEGR
jgi:nucleoside-diphosphate-sugar epimerase